MTQDPRYPIGKYQPTPFSEAIKNQWIQDIRIMPSDLEHVLLNLDKAQLETPYREGGWNVQQVVHHLADSHMNAFIRFKLALTEEVPPIKTYDENAWVLSADVMNTPHNYSVTLLHALHERWANLLASLTPEQFERKLFHPVRNAEITIWDLFTIYAWHGKHHIAHIKTLRDQKGW